MSKTESRSETSADRLMAISFLSAPASYMQSIPEQDRSRIAKLLRGQAELLD